MHRSDMHNMGIKLTRVDLPQNWRYLKIDADLMSTQIRRWFVAPYIFNVFVKFLNSLTKQMMSFIFLKLES